MNYNSQANSEGVMGFLQKEAEVIANKTGVPAKYVVIAIIICLASIIIGFLDSYIVTFIGVVYPAIQSIKAIESPDEDDDKQWLTYWIVFGLFSFVELFIGFILKFIPFYFILKMIFLLWLFLPNFNGALKIYKLFVYKIFKKYENDINKIENKANNFINQNMANMGGNGNKRGTNEINISSNLPNN
jgi:receptor expression-enhancing protein 5/6